jgi:peptide/nickel transport system ATP-binding protein
MYLGKLCEVADSAALFASPAHPYTAALIAAIPEPDPDRPLGDTKLRPGDPPSPLDPPSGCRFRTRCPHAEPRCTTEVPPLRQIAPGREVACHFPLI